MKYKILLFDLDNTLLDFNANEKVSLNKLFSAHNIPLTDEVMATYQSINRGLWESYEKGEITFDMLACRFPNTLKAIGANDDGTGWEKEYRSYLSCGYQLVDGAIEICERLSEDYRLFIATNGVRETQEKRISNSGLAPFFERVYNSQSVGYQKPQVQFFEHLAKDIDGFDKSTVLMIGDALATDIKGGIDFGIDTCWVNITSKPNTTELKPTYEIKSLYEILDIVK